MTLNLPPEATAVPPTNAPEPRRVFTVLVGYRWLSLLAPLLALLLQPDRLPAGALATAVVANLLITRFHGRLNRALRIRPWLLLFDLGLAALLVTLSGGWRTPFYLYALNPLLIAAFFFGLRGALAAATAFLPFYIGGVLTAAALGDDAPNWLIVITSVTGAYLISAAFGYAANVVRQLRRARDELAEAHRDLETIHALMLSLQSAPDAEAVQERVLTAVTRRLGCRQAVVGLVDETEQVVTGWLGCKRDGDVSENGLPHPARIPLGPEGGLVGVALQTQQIQRAAEEPCTADGRLNTHFGMKNCLILPMNWGIRPVGVLLVDVSEREADTALRHSLEAMARQTAVILGLMQTRRRHARESAIQEERARIAQDIHDTVSQSLFGIVYTLDGSLKLLDKDPAAIKPELAWALRTAEEMRRKLRQLIDDIWEDDLTAERFQIDLQKYAADVLQAAGLCLDFDVRGEFSALSPRTQRTMYRVCQESLANIVHHAAAAEARICVDVAAGRAKLVVRDNGRGFEPHVALAQEYDDAHFGLRGMQERARLLGGTCDIFSRPEAGTTIVMDIPA